MAYFVNSHSLITYVSYALLTQPVTINGMFYAIRRDILDGIGGFTGLEHFLADDFAIAQRVRTYGYRLAQTPLRHAISTWIGQPAQLLSPDPSLVYLSPRIDDAPIERARENLFYAIALLPVFLPWLILVFPFFDSRLWPVTGLYFAYNYMIFAHINWIYLKQASPWADSYWVVLISIMLPLQILVALLAPQRIIWRGHTMQAEPGGGFQFVQRRKRG